MKNIYLFFFLTVAIHTSYLDIRDVSTHPNVVVNINGHTYNSTTKKINLKEFDLPIYVNIHSINKERKYFKPLLSKTFYMLEDRNIISNKETIIELLYSEIKKKIYVPAKDYLKIRNVIIKNFKKEIEVYVNNKEKGMIQRIRKLNWIKIENKINKTIGNLQHNNSHTRTLDLSLIENLGSKYMELYVLNKNIKNKTLNFLSKHEELKNYTPVKAPFNKDILVFIYNKSNDKLLFSNYLSPHINKVDKTLETKQLISFEFDRLLMECTHNNNNQRVCYYFDIVEHYVPSKENLLNKIFSNIPFHIKNDNTEEKIKSIRETFLDTMIKIVNGNKQ